MPSQHGLIQMSSYLAQGPLIFSVLSHQMGGLFVLVRSMFIFKTEFVPSLLQHINDKYNFPKISLFSQHKIFMKTYSFSLSGCVVFGVGGPHLMMHRGLFLDLCSGLTPSGAQGAFCGTGESNQVYVCECLPFYIFWPQ